MRAVSHHHPAAAQRRKSPSSGGLPPQEQRSGSGGGLLPTSPGSASCAQRRSCCAISARRDHTLVGSIGRPGRSTGDQSHHLPGVFGVGQFALIHMVHVCSGQTLALEDGATHWRLSRKLLPHTGGHRLVTDG